MTFTITAKCASGHTALPLSVDLPGREWADELIRIFEKGKCMTCDAPLTVNIGTPTDQN
jgi:hypothetical protein